jgi:hypothetical protein
VFLQGTTGSSAGGLEGPNIDSAKQGSSSCCNSSIVAWQRRWYGGAGEQQGTAAAIQALVGIKGLLRAPMRYLQLPAGGEMWYMTIVAAVWLCNLPRISCISVFYCTFILLPTLGGGGDGCGVL